MIQKCDFHGCDKAGVCRAPKSRDLDEYFHFCREHAAEYNKNWNYYANMTTEQIDADWERSVFGYAPKDKKTAAAETEAYLKFLDDFVKGRMAGGRQPKATPAAPIAAAFKTLTLAPTASWRDVQTAFRTLAKKYHPDTAKNLNNAAAAEKFTAISSAYSVLEKHFKK